MREFLHAITRTSLESMSIELTIMSLSTGAVRIHIFDHTIRRQPKDERSPAAAFRGPVRRVHIDQSYTASEQRVTHHLPEDADELLQKRFQIINASHQGRKDPQIAKLIFL